MKKGTTTIFLIILFFCTFRLVAQDNSLLPFSNKLLLNPSYAGLNKNTSVRTGTFLHSEGNSILDNEFYLTWDSYSESLKGGVALSFYEGLSGSENTNTTGIGFTFSKPVAVKSKNTVIPSLNFNYRLATKNWFVQAMEPLNPPGREILRFHKYQPRVGLLWHSPVRHIGLSVAWNFYSPIAREGIAAPESNPEFIVHYLQNRRSKNDGLNSEPVKLTPEFIMLYTQNVFLTRSGVSIKEVNRNYAFFIQNSFRKNVHGIGGMWGVRFNNFRLNILAAPAYNFTTKKTSFWGEVAFALVVPYVHINKKYPWKPVKKFF